MKTKIESKINMEEVVLETAIIPAKRSIKMFVFSFSCFAFSVLFYIALLSSTVYYNLYSQRNLNQNIVLVDAEKNVKMENLQVDRSRVSFISLETDTSVSLK